MENKVLENPNTITDEQIEEVNEVINSMTEEEHKILEEAKKQAAEPDQQGFEGTATIVTNPITGKPMHILEDDEFELPSFEEMMADDSIEPLDIDESKVSITRDMVREKLVIYLKDYPITDDDIDKVLALANRLKNKEKFSFFASMPDSVKEGINILMGLEASAALGSFIKEGLNYLAGSILNDIVDEAVREVAYNDLQKSIARVRIESAGEMKKDSYWSDYKKYLLYGTVEKAKRLRDDGKNDLADKYDNIRKSFIESYKMEDMLSLYKTGKIKIRKIDIEKFPKTCRNFNMKYENTTQVINNIAETLPILDRFAMKHFAIDTLKEFICIFIKYTDIKKMKPENIVDHVFMYNWIMNIISLDLYNPEDEFAVTFRQELLDSINNFLQEIIDFKGGKVANG